MGTRRAALALGLLLAATRAGAAKAPPPDLDALEAQLADRESAARLREVASRAAAEQLDAREQSAVEQAAADERRERELEAREKQLDARESATRPRGAPAEQEPRRDAADAQLVARERQLAAQDRSFGPAVDAAAGREREAGARERAERDEATRLAASVPGASPREAQLDLRRQALAARNRQLAAFDAVLLARRDRLDALDGQLHARHERLDVWGRRLDARAERLQALEAPAQAAPVAGAAPKPAERKPGGASRGKGAVTIVVRSPTAIVKERPGATAAAPPGPALHPGVVVERPIAAATVVSYPTAESAISELDRETVEGIARLAAKERCELLVWARAADAGLMAEAARRAEEIRSRAVDAGLDGGRVVTRITTRPGAQGVDVVVSALRETSAPAAAQAASSGPAAPALLPGESGRRQLRDALVALQPSMEACVAEQMQRHRLERADATLTLSVSPAGKATGVVTGGGDLAGSDVDECLGRAAAAWTLPAGDTGYVADVPITAIRTGAAR